MSRRRHMPYAPGAALLYSAVVLCIFFVSGCTEKDLTPSSTGDKVYRIGFGYFGPDDAVDRTIDGFLAGLNEEGFEEGRNIEIVRKHAFGEIAQLPQIMQSLDNMGLDLIVPMTTPGLAAAFRAVKNTPIVFVHTYDPLGAGAGRSFEDHLPNITGVASFPPIEATMEAVFQIIPRAGKVGTLYNASEANSLKAVAVARKVLEARGVELEEMTVGGTGDVFTAAQALVSRNPDAIWITGDNTVHQALEGVVRAASASSVPVILNDPEGVERGALAAVGVSWHESGAAAGKMAARVLRGESPANIPIVEMSVRRVVLNHEVARKMGIDFPSALVEEANRTYQ